MLGSLIGAAADIFGGILGRNSAEKQNFENQVAQREFAQHGIRWRVEDAKAAGLHPLYALGGSGATFTPGPISTHLGDSLSRAGQSVARAVSAQETEDQRRERELRLKVLESQIGENDARAAYFRSQAVGGGVTPNQVPPAFPRSGADVQTFGYVPVGDIPTVSLNPDEQYSADFPGKYDLVKAEPSKVPSANPSAEWVSAGPARPGFDRHRITKNLELLLPRNEEGWSEGIESVPFWMWPAVYKANVDYYGDGGFFWRLLLQELGPDNDFVKWVSRIGMYDYNRSGPAVGRVRNYDGSYR